MDPSLYWLGVIFAILSGILNNFGTVLQKKIVNEHRDDKEFMKNLIKNPIWFFGLILQLAIGSVFFILAQLYIGPAIIPGLMAAGLIILALGSVAIVGETLKKPEVIGIVLMILAITLLGFSEFSIEINAVNLTEIFFIIRLVTFTLILFLASLICEFFQKRNERYRSIFLAISSGFMFSLSNFWIGPLMGLIDNIFGGTFILAELLLFICACVILIVANVVGMIRINKSFKQGQASNLIPIQQVPIQITPVFIYFFVFLLPAPSILSMIFLIIAVFLIIISSFLLGKRQAQLEEIQK